jgi:hypothetical protein
MAASIMINASESLYAVQKVLRHSKSRLKNNPSITFHLLCLSIACASLARRSADSAIY